MPTLTIDLTRPWEDEEVEAIRALKLGSTQRTSGSTKIVVLMDRPSTAQERSDLLAIAGGKIPSVKEIA